MSLEAGALTILVFKMHCLATDVEASGIIVRSASAGGRFHASKTFPGSKNSIFLTFAQLWSLLHDGWLLS
jgi:hypothetical protein